jgi:hypothetical protein
MLEIFLLSLIVIIFSIVLLKNKLQRIAVLSQGDCSLQNKRNILITGENYSLEFPVIFIKNNAATIIKNNLPIEGKINKWAEGIYFSTNINVSQFNDKASNIVVGDVAYWPENKAICIFYLPSPAYENEKQTTNSPVIKIGHTSAKPELLKKIAIGDKIEII